MDQAKQSGRRRFLAQGGAVALACAGLHAVLPPVGSAGAAHQGDDQEAQNLANFDRLNYEAWNRPNWDLFRQLHTDDVVVEVAGQRTEGIEAHVAWAQGFVAAFRTLRWSTTPSSSPRATGLPSSASSPVAARW